MKTLKKLLIAIGLGLAIGVTAYANTGTTKVTKVNKYHYTCLVTKMHTGNTFYKFTINESKKIGPLGFDYIPSRHYLKDAANDKYKYITSVQADNGKVIDTYQNDNILLLVPSPTSEEWQKAGMEDTTKKDRWYELFCKVETEKVEDK